jgi:hypothetical protein
VPRGTFVDRVHGETASLIGRAGKGFEIQIHKI